ncbi:hypothetical protein Bbelb_166000 [Branchiostoma belcheri]|nr:hypothetical protein Bbelb_166000 [Branchiostoma belcheri]
MSDPRLVGVATKNRPKLAIIPPTTSAWRVRFSLDPQLTRLKSYPVCRQDNFEPSGSGTQAKRRSQVGQHREVFEELWGSHGAQGTDKQTVQLVPPLHNQIPESEPRLRRRSGVPIENNTSGVPQRKPLKLKLNLGVRVKRKAILLHSGYHRGMELDRHGSGYGRTRQARFWIRQIWTGTVLDTADLDRHGSGYGRSRQARFWIRQN